MRRTRPHEILFLSAVWLVNRARVEHQKLKSCYGMVLRSLPTDEMIEPRWICSGSFELAVLQLSRAHQPISTTHLYVNLSEHNSHIERLLTMASGG